MKYERLTFRYESVDGTKQVGYTEKLIPCFNKQAMILNRLAELEDKIEQGTLKEIPEGAVVLTREDLADMKFTQEHCDLYLENKWLKECIPLARKETVDKFAERLKARFHKSREYYEVDTGTAWSNGCIGGLINNTIDEIAKEIVEGKV